MAEINNRRLTAMLLQDKIAAVFAAVAPLRMTACLWTIDGLDASLPEEAAVAAVLEGYQALNIPAMNTRAAIRDIEASDAGEGYTLPQAPSCAEMHGNSGLIIPSDGGLTISSTSGIEVNS